jgi:pimeloyl-ACP methyl ester carboxylesterase
MACPKICRADTPWPLLAERYQVLTFDWPGFGGIDPLPSPEDYTSRRFADVIVDFMDTLGIGQSSLVATDIALLPALLVGLEHPTRGAKLAVMDGIPFSRPEFSSWELKSLAKNEVVDPWQGLGSVVSGCLGPNRLPQRVL